MPTDSKIDSIFTKTDLRRGEGYKNLANRLQNSLSVIEKDKPYLSTICQNFLSMPKGFH